jgi:molybdenum cofactor biosynthesis enzyme MoaA
VALRHIQTARHPIVSFGQGCEGEPLLSFQVIRKALSIIRKTTSRGTIHMNTNASLPSKIETLCDEGLDSLRVSMNSAQDKHYQRYYAPSGYTFRDVMDSILIAKRKGKFVAINYLVMPGFTDRDDEFKALTALIRRTSADMIQWRNLNYDPHQYFTRLGLASRTELLGMRRVMAILSKEFPHLKHGYFNLSKDMYQNSDKHL